MGTVPRGNTVSRRPLAQVRHLLASLFALAVLCVIGPAQQQTKPQAQNPDNTGQLPQAGVIKVEAPSVVLDVIVTDKKGRPVSGLTAADFEVYENNAPQKIITFVPPIPPKPPAEGAGAPSAHEGAAGQRPTRASRQALAELPLPSNRGEALASSL